MHVVAIAVASLHLHQCVEGRHDHIALDDLQDVCWGWVFVCVCVCVCVCVRTNRPKFSQMSAQHSKRTLNILKGPLNGPEGFGRSAQISRKGPPSTPKGPLNTFLS